MRRDCVAMIASPLQAISLQEAVSAATIPVPDVVVVRPPTAATEATMRLCDETVRAAATTTSAASTVARLLRDAGQLVLGDPYSALVHSVIATRRREPAVVVLEDGAASLRAWRDLARGVALVRAHEQRARARALARLATRRLTRLAAHGELTVFGALPLAADVAVALERRRVRSVRHDFTWTRSVPLPSDACAEHVAGASHVLLGSALCTDGFITRAAYERWLSTCIGRDGAIFLPHRREAAWTLDLAAELGAVVRPPHHLPAELLLRSLDDEALIDTLPNTAALSLPIVRGGRSTRLRVTRVERSDWTRTAPEEMVDLVTEITHLTHGVVPDDNLESP